MTKRKQVSTNGTLPRLRQIYDWDVLKKKGDILFIPTLDDKRANSVRAQASKIMAKKGIRLHVERVPKQNPKPEDPVRTDAAGKPFPPGVVVTFVGKSVSK